MTGAVARHWVWTTTKMCLNPHEHERAEGGPVAAVTKKVAA